MTDDRLDGLRATLARLGDAIRDEVVAHRDQHGLGGLADVVGLVEADTIFAIDKVSEDRVLAWFATHWPTDEPVRLVMEGVDDGDLVTFPAGTAAADVAWICVIDPIDGTRNLMYDKRPAWALASLAPATLDRRGIPGARLRDVVVATMTEIPTSKQWRADQVSGIRGCGPAGLVTDAVDVRSGDRLPVALAPTAVTHLEHGFASFSHYLPDGKALLATIEQQLWDELMPPAGGPRQIFEDEYICSAGQLFEVLAGRDRLVGDLRPLALAHLGLPLSLTGHPYDICTAMLLTEAGGVFEDPWGATVDVPLDTTSPVTWVAYANRGLADLVQPALARALEHLLELPAAGGG